MFTLNNHASWALAIAVLGLLSNLCSTSPHDHMHRRSELPPGAEGSLRGAMDALLSRQRQMSAAANRQFPNDQPQPWPQTQTQQDFGNTVEEMQYYPSRFDKTPAYPFFDRESGSYRQSPFREHSTWNQPDKRGTAFRERLSGIKTHPRDELAELFLKNIEEDEARERQHEREQQRNEEYEEMVEDMFQKYRGKDYDDSEQDLARIFGGRNEVKRQLAGDYQPVGWGPVGFRKRSFRDRYDDDVSENDLMQALKYIPTDALERLLAEEEAATNNLQIMNQPRHGNYEMYPNKEQGYWRNTDPTMRKKRFPVTKRNKGFSGNKKKRSSETEKPATTTEADDKIAKDLSSIFGTKTKKEKSEDKDKDKKSLVKKSAKQTKVVVEKHNGTDGHDHTHYGEVLKLDQVLPAKPLEVKKKDINWSQYFGIDKRNKKSPEEREEWIKHKYLANSMRDFSDLKQDEYPLKSFKHHDMDKKYYQPFDTRVFEQGREPGYQNEMVPDYEDVDDKLKDIEDILLDEAAKYTEAREADPEEINQLRQMVISRLSEMYGNERTHRTSDYRSNFPERNHAMDFVDDKAKRVAVKKESADPARNDTSEDKIKRTQRPAQEPFSEGYMGGRQGLHHTGDILECPIIQSIAARCHNVGVWAGDKGQLFLPLCTTHQICYMCGPTGPEGCDFLYLSEADMACSGDRECRRVARDGLGLMRELHASSDQANECARHPCLAELKHNEIVLCEEEEV